MSNPLVDHKVRRQKHPRKVDKYRNSIPYIYNFLLNDNCQRPVQDSLCPERAGHYWSPHTQSVKNLDTNYI